MSLKQPAAILANTISLQTLAPRTTAFTSAVSTSPSRRHHHHHHHYSSSPSPTPDITDAEALAARRIEDAIHRIIVIRSAPDWLSFLPGASYWVPPKRRDYGVALLLHHLSNSLSDDQVMSLATSPRGWPSSSFYLHQPPPPPLDASSDTRALVEISNFAPASEGEEA